MSLGVATARQLLLAVSVVQDKDRRQVGVPTDSHAHELEVEVRTRASSTIHDLAFLPPPADAKIELDSAAQEDITTPRRQPTHPAVLAYAIYGGVGILGSQETGAGTGALPPLPPTGAPPTLAQATSPATSTPQPAPKDSRPSLTDTPAPPATVPLCTSPTSDAPCPADMQIGAAAVLTISVAPNGRYLAAGCLDSRVRLFPLDATAPSSRTSCQPQIPAVDWVGFDGPVRTVAWSTSGRWLAACGGSCLVAIEPRVHRGASAPGSDKVLTDRAVWLHDKPPVLCVSPTTDSDTGGRERVRAVDATGHASTTPRTGRARFATMAWSPSHPETLLAAMEQRTAKVHLFNVAMADGAVPRCAHPIAIIPMPSCDTGARHSRLLAGASNMALTFFTASSAGTDQEGEEAGEGEVTGVPGSYSPVGPEPRLLVSSGDGIAAVQIQLRAYLATKAAAGVSERQ